MTDIDLLKEQQRKIRDQIDKVETEERIAEAQTFVGKCFRYRNCYSCPDGEADKWWLYIRVVEVTKTGWLSVFQFQTDKYGQHFIHPKERMSMGRLGEPITNKQFQHAWKILVKRLGQSAREAKAVA